MSPGPAADANANPGPAASGPLWSRRDLADPHASEDKATRVRGMFQAIAPSYDLNNRLHSLGLDQHWRRAAVRMARVREGERVLDVACGTGDLTFAFARGPAREVVGCDFTGGMLELAQRKRRRRPLVASKVTFEHADAMALPYEDGAFDIVSIAFGIRNVQDPARALAEFRRVLGASGRLVVLEFVTPRSRVVAALNGFYAGKVMPLTATLLSRDRTGAYRYLPSSVRTFMDREQMAGAMRGAGFAQVRSRVLLPGICACYLGAVAGD